MSDLMNPVKIIQWIFDFAKGVVDFMETSITIPLVGSMPIWSMFVGALAPILMYVLVKRLLL